MLGKNTQKSKTSDRQAPFILFLILIGIWEALVLFEVVPSYMLPGPLDVIRALIEDAPLIYSHAKTTLIEALLGLFIGVTLGFIVACLMDRFKTLDRALSPLITVSQTIPTVAIAPLLVLWLGYEMLPKVVLVVLTTFFPIAISLRSGFKSVDEDMICLMRTMKASSGQIFRYVKIPASLDHFFSGLKISATYAIVGAVISEWLGGFSGLGVYMTRVRKSFAYDRMFAVIIVISVLSLLLMKTVDLIQVRAMPWKYIEGNKDA